MATFPVLVLRGLSTSLYALVSSVAVLWLVEPILLLGLAAALTGLAPALELLHRVTAFGAEVLVDLLDRWALWVSGWPGAQIYFDTAYAALVCLLLAALLGLAWHWNIPAAGGGARCAAHSGAGHRGRKRLQPGRGPRGTGGQ